MKITAPETLLGDAGRRPWVYVKVETDEGVTGWGTEIDEGGREGLLPGK